MHGSTCSQKLTRPCVLLASTWYCAPVDTSTWLTTPEYADRQSGHSICSPARATPWDRSLSWWRRSQLTQHTPTESITCVDLRSHESILDADSNQPRAIHTQP